MVAIWPGTPVLALDTWSMPDARAQALEKAVHFGAQAEEYFSQRAYAAAEPLYRDAFVIFEATLGPDAIHIAGPLHNLARFYRSWGRFDQARVSLRGLPVRDGSGAKQPSARPCPGRHGGHLGCPGS